jgi:hypothetical protein
LSAFFHSFLTEKNDEAWGLGFTDDRYFKLCLLSLHDVGITSFL